MDVPFGRIDGTETLLTGGVEGTDDVPVAQKAETIRNADRRFQVAQACGDGAGLPEIACRREGTEIAGEDLLARYFRLGRGRLKQSLHGVEAKLGIVQPAV